MTKRCQECNAPIKEYQQIAQIVLLIMLFRLYGIEEQLEGQSVFMPNLWLDYS
jgi:hypothetical protein